MTIITNGAYVYCVYYIARNPYLMQKDATYTGEKDYKKIQADSPQQANDIMLRQLQSYHDRDNRWSYQLLPHSTHIDNQD